RAPLRPRCTAWPSSALQHPRGPSALHSAPPGSGEALPSRRSSSTPESSLGTSRRRPAPALEGTLPVLPVVVPRLPGPDAGSGSIALAIGWLHEAGDPPHPALRGGSMTLAIRWLHESGETLRTCIVQAGDWHKASLQTQNLRMSPSGTGTGWPTPARASNASATLPARATRALPARATRALPARATR